LRAKTASRFGGLLFAFASIDFGEPEKPDSQFSQRTFHRFVCGEADINHQSGANRTCGKNRFSFGVRLRIPWLTSVDGT